MQEEAGVGNGSSSVACLLDNEGHEIPLNRDVVTCGRAEENDVFLNDTSVSRHHARLERGVVGCEVVDLGSTNGTFVNGERLLDGGSRPLQDGDQVAFGGCTFVYRAAAPDSNVARVSEAAPAQEPREHLTQQLFVAVPEIVQVDQITYAVIRAQGVLNGETIESVLTACRFLVEQNVLRILVETRDVEYIDSAGIGGLVRLQRELQTIEGGIGIVAPSPAVRQVIELLNLSTFLPMYAEKGQALGTVPPGAREEEEDRRAAIPRTADAPHLVLPDGQTWPLAGRAVSMGREVGNDILINDPQVAPQHARIVQAAQHFVLLDLRSGAGTFLNGEQIRDLHLLNHGDEIKLGEAAFRFYGGPVGVERGTSANAGIPVLRFKELPLGDGELTIGRSAESGLVISDDRVSSEHAKIVRANGDYWLLDLGSSNGTFVNEQRVPDVHLLRHGDVIALGATTLTFERRVIRVAEDEPEPAAPLAFIFSEPTGRRWLAVRIVAVIAILLLAGVSAVFVRFILQ